MGCYLQPDTLVEMSRRTRIVIPIVAVALLLLAGALFLRMKSPPEVARLLPECDGIVYFNLSPLRAATHFDRHPVQHDPDYQYFIDATGIHPERDLEQAAFALDRMPNPNGPNGPVAFSEVFEGRFNRGRLADYLKSIAATTETYAGRTIFIIPNDGRTVRVALLGRDFVAVSNTPTEEQIHSIIDRYRMAVLPFSGPSLLSALYSDVPLLSPAWGIGKIGLPLSDGAGGISILGVSLPFSPNATFVASLQWMGETRLRVVEIAPNAQAAGNSADAVNNLLKFVRNIEDVATIDKAQPQLQADVRAMLDSAKVAQQKNRVVLTATLPDGLLKQLMNAPTNVEVSAGPKGSQQQKR